MGEIRTDIVRVLVEEGIVVSIVPKIGPIRIAIIVPISIVQKYGETVDGQIDIA